MESVVQQKLRNELKEIIDIADKQNHNFVGARKLLYEGLSKLLVWWMKASKQKGLLESIYAEREIAYKKETTHAVAFTPLLRVVWSIDHVQYSNTIDQWNRALNKMWDEVQANSEYYKKNTVERLISYISNKGGISKLTGYKAEEEVSNEKEPRSASTTKKRELTQAATDAAHYAAGKKYFTTTSSALAKLRLKRELQIGDGQLVVGVLRKKGAAYELLGTTADEAALQQAVINSYKRYSTSQALTLRFLTEILHTQALPPSMASLARTLPDSTNVLAENGQKMKAIKRLRYCAKSKTFLLSPSRTDCGVVTLATPKARLIIANEDVVTTAQDRVFIESALIQKGDYNLYEVDSANAIKRTAKGSEAATHKLKLTHKAIPLVRYVRFYPISIHKTSSQPQAALKGALKFKPVWQSTWDIDWICDSYATFWAQWINGYGKQITRPQNKVLKLALGKASVAVGYNLRGTTFADVEQLNGAGRVLGKAISVNVLSKDMIPVIHALANMEINGGVRIAVSDALVLFSFKTHSAVFTVAVPTCTIKGKRNNACFASYNG